MKERNPSPIPEKDSKSPHCFSILREAELPSQDLSCVWGISCKRTLTLPASVEAFVSTYMYVQVLMLMLMLV